MLFKDGLHNDFGTWPLAYIPSGGADYGEVRAVAEAVGDGDDGAYHAAWVAAGDRLAAEAEVALKNGHRASAHEAWLRAAAFYGASYHPLYGAPVDPRLMTAFRRQMEAFEAALALDAVPSPPLTIRYVGGDMPAYLVRALGRETERRPLVVLNGGYDSTVTDSYFATAVAASRRGYHCLLFDGPGQGGMLYERGIPLRPDWDVVIRAVVDAAVTLPVVDPSRIALAGWSLGGLLAPLGAAGEPRIAALIADPGLWSIADQFRATVVHTFGVAPEDASDLGRLDAAVIDRLDAAVRADRRLRWKVVQRGFWVHGVDNLRDYLAASEAYTMTGRIEAIRCPTFVAAAEGDPLSTSAAAFYAALRCPKTFVQFTAAEGADGHCEMQNRSLFNRRMLDWLDAVLG